MNWMRIHPQHNLHTRTGAIAATAMAPSVLSALQNHTPLRSSRHEGGRRVVFELETFGYLTKEKKTKFFLAGGGGEGGGFSSGYGNTQEPKNLEKCIFRKSQKREIYQWKYL
jgi:hypothetical protein